MQSSMDSREYVLKSALVSELPENEMPSLPAKSKISGEHCVDKWVQWKTYRRRLQRPLEHQEHDGRQGQSRMNEHR